MFSKNYFKNNYYVRFYCYVKNIILNLIILLKIKIIS